MKKIQISDSEVRLIVILLSIVFLALSYFFVLNKGLQNAELINGECDTIQAEIDNLNSMIAKKKIIEEETVAMRQKIVDVVAKYPVARPTEKSIYEIQKLEDMTEAHFTSINLGMSQPMLPGENGVMGYKNVISMQYDCPYENLKILFDYVKDNKTDRMNISAISLDYDMETGNIAGKIDLNLYYLTGTNREYDELPEMDFGFGMDNVFLGNSDIQDHPINTFGLEEIDPTEKVEKTEDVNVENDSDDEED